jgi:hypothetical protein
MENSICQSIWSLSLPFRFLHYRYNQSMSVMQNPFSDQDHLPEPAPKCTEKGVIIQTRT